MATIKMKLVTAHTLIAATSPGVIPPADAPPQTSLQTLKFIWCPLGLSLPVNVHIMPVVLSIARS